MSRRSRQGVAPVLAAAGVAMLVFANGDRPGTPLRRWMDRLAGADAATPTASGDPATARPTAARAAPLAAARAPGAVPHPAAPTAVLPPPGSASSGLGRIRQLTFDGCCAGAWWAPDGSAVHFIDRPGGQIGIYGVAIWPPGALPQMIDAEVTVRASGARYLIRPAGDASIVTDVASGAEWPLPTGGAPARLSPDGSRVVWWDAPGGRAEVDSLNRIHASDIAGQAVREIGGLWGANVVGFLANGVEVLVVGRPLRDSAMDVLAALDTDTGAVREIARGTWVTDVVLAPGGAWVAYMVSLDSAAPEANGIWVAPTGAGAGPPRRLDRVGAYRWRDPVHLLMVPLEPGAPAHSVWQIDAATGDAARIVDPAEIEIRIANNDWSVSPDGRRLAFVSEADRNVWLVELP